jgi:hypothetical protein
MRRLVLPLLILGLAAGCGSGSGSTTTVTQTEPPTATDTTKTGATETEPPPQEENGERIDVGTFLAFEMPSKRIGCAVTTDPTTLRCDTAFPTRFSRLGRTCDMGDYGQAFLMRRNGPARAICAGDTVLSATNSHTFAYGKTWLLGPYTCVSRKAGLSCRNPDGHGISLSLQAQKVF